MSIFGASLNWMGPHANVQDVKVFRAKKDSWGDKPGGGSKAVYSHTLENVAVMPRTTASRGDGTGFQGSAATGKSLFVPDDAQIEPDDEVEIIDARGQRSRWKIDGDVDTDYANPLSSFSPGREIQIKKIGGRS